MKPRLILLTLTATLSFAVTSCSRTPQTQHPLQTKGDEMRGRYSSPESLSKITGLEVPSDLPEKIRQTNALSSNILRTAKATAGRNPVIREALEHPDLCDPNSAAVDFRALNIMSPVKDQGECGACWAFATNSVLESAYLSLRKEHIAASEQELISCSSAGSCKGGWWAFDFLMKPGIESSGNYPYDGADSTCRMPISTEFRALRSGYVSTDAATARSSVPTSTELKSAMCKHGPLVVAFRATPGFVAFGWDHHDQNSVFSENDTGEVNHGIVLAGWDDSKQAWIIKNSWGTDWGENGYMRVKYGSNRIGLGAAWAEAWPKDYTPAVSVRSLFSSVQHSIK